MQLEVGQLQKPIKAVLKPLFNFAWRVSTDGLENIPTDGGAIIAPNHISVLDSFFVPAVLPRRITYVGKAEYMDSWKTRYIFPAIGMVPIDRSGGNAASAALDTAAGILGQGELFGIYPEGTRSPDGRTAECQPGVILLARRAKVPLVLMVTEGSHDAWPRNRKLPMLRGAIEVEIAPPITPEQLAERLRQGTEGFLEQLRHEMEEMRMRCRQRLRERTRGSWPPPGDADTPYWSA